jgi:hypothetical protein
MRKRGTFARRQGRLEEAMEVDDEIRAMRTILRSLAQLPDAASRQRVMAYVLGKVHDDAQKASLERDGYVHERLPLPSRDGLGSAQEYMRGGKAAAPEVGSGD